MILKKFPQDFLVEEIPIGFAGSGEYAIYKLTKKDYNTESAIEHICRRFNIRRASIKYAGSKDRHAITMQFISIFKDKGSLHIDSDGLKLDFVTFHNEPLSLGCLEGNNFTIRIREVDAREMSSFYMRHTQENSQRGHILEYMFPNYYDDQRFSENNYEIGMAILKRDFRLACELAGVEASSGDFVGALKRVPSKTLLFYIHAVQSHIFNQELSDMISHQKDRHMSEYRLGRLFFAPIYDDSVPSSLTLAGFDSEKHFLTDLGLSARDFIIRQFPDLSVEGVSRECLVKTDIDYVIEDNEIVLQFALPKGAYATMLVKSLFAVPQTL